MKYLMFCLFHFCGYECDAQQDTEADAKTIFPAMTGRDL